MTPTILVVDDDPEIRNLIIEMLSADGYELVGRETGDGALEYLTHTAPAAVLLDVNMPGMNGLDVLARARALQPDTPIVMVTSATDIKTAVSAMQLGADDYLTKPFGDGELRLRVRRALERQALVGEVRQLKTLAHSEALTKLSGLGAQMQAVLERVKQVANSPLTVLVQGETGTGKEIVA